MRKQTKLVAVLSTAALLAIGASMTSFAATGWQEEDGTWVYYNRDEEKATESWKKSGDNWFWLDDNGEMATDTLVEDDDDTYYVDANGAMVRNQWVAIDNEEAGEDDEPDHYWYYFQSNGKAYKRGENASTINAKTINGKKYAFDTDGKMLYGWVNASGERQTGDDAWKADGDSSVYYFGDEDDGAMRVNEWALISIVDDDPDTQQPGDEFWSEDQDRWFYFQASGKRKQASSGKTYTDKTINGKKYGFDEYGRMVASWYTADVATINKATTNVDPKNGVKYSTDSNAQGTANYSSSFMYFSSPEDGARYTKGWFKVAAGYYLNQGNYEDDSEKWYYADGDGHLYANEIKRIKGKKYAFDEYGRMISGLAFIEFKNGETTDKIEYKYGDDAAGREYDTEDAYKTFVNNYSAMINDGQLRAYYFGGSDDGAMKTGKQTITLDGESFTFKFNTGSYLKGAGLVGYDDEKIYMAGMQVKADKDDKYEVVQVVVKDGTQKITEMSTQKFLTTVNATSETNKDGVTYKFASLDNKKSIKDALTLKDGKEYTYYFLVNTSGSVIKNKTNGKDGDDYKYTVKDYIITSVSLDD